MKKKNIILIIVALCIVIVAGGGFYFYNSKKNNEKKIEAQISAIEKKVEEFTNSNERSGKLEALKSTKDDFKKYKEENQTTTTVTQAYEKTITQMTKYFTDDYDKVESENTISNINEVEKGKLIESETNLKDLVVTINNETGIVLEDNAAKGRTDKIEETIAIYDNKIAELDKKEKEEAEKKAQEEKKKTENAVADGQLTNAIHYENEYFKVDVPEKWRGSWSILEMPKNDDKIIATYSFGKSNLDSPIGGGGGQTVYIIDPDNLSKLRMTDLTIVGKTANGLGVYLGAGASDGFFEDKYSSAPQAKIAVK